MCMTLLGAASPNVSLGEDEPTIVRSLTLARADYTEFFLAQSWINRASAVARVTSR